jgi:hypothetical protein
VKLIVYNVQGKEITTLADKEFRAGTYEVEFNGSNLPSGIYFYRLTIGGNVIDTKKAVLIK